MITYILTFGPTYPQHTFVASLPTTASAAHRDGTAIASCTRTGSFWHGLFGCARSRFWWTPDQTGSSPWPSRHRALPPIRWVGRQSSWTRVRFFAFPFDAPPGFHWSPTTWWRWPVIRFPKRFACNMVVIIFGVCIYTNNKRTVSFPYLTPLGGFTGDKWAIFMDGAQSRVLDSCNWMVYLFLDNLQWIGITLLVKLEIVYFSSVDRPIGIDNFGGVFCFICNKMRGCVQGWAVTPSKCNRRCQSTVTN